MAENSSLGELVERHLDENENPSLHDLNTTDSKVIETNVKTADSDYTKICSVSLTEKVETDVSIRLEKLTLNKNTSFDREFSENGDITLPNFGKNNLAESLNNNNLVNGSYESNISFPDPNLFLVENSPCSNESKKLNFSSDENVNALLDTSISFNDNIIECKKENLALESNVNGDILRTSISVLSENVALESNVNVDIPSASTSVCSAFSENVECNRPPAAENRPLLLEESMPAQIFEFPKPADIIDISENKDIAFIGEDNDGETFQDAVQFFKDPSSLQFLDNINTSEHVQTGMPRDSLYMTFDPLLKNYANPPAVKESPPLAIPPEVSLDVSDQQKDKIEDVNPVDVESDEPPPLNKPLADVAKRESFGNILLSFDSPLKTNSARSSQKVEASPFSNAPKLYTEEEMQQALKISELTIQESYLKKQKEMEEESVKKLQEKDETIKKSSQLCKVLHEIVNELFNVSAQLKQENETISSKIEELESEKKKLASNVTTSTDALESVEKTFSDFHSRYLQCKDMLKKYKDNEDVLKEQISSLHKRLEEQEQMYDMLQAKTEEMVEKANAEVANAKKGGDAQIAVLKAQLKKSELKISSLESDLKQVRIENDKLSGICDDLMAKVSET